MRSKMFTESIFVTIQPNFWMFIAVAATLPHLREKFYKNVRFYRPKFEMTRDTSSTASWSMTIPDRLIGYPGGTEPMTADRPAGGPYTLGNDGAVAEIGLEVPSVPVPATDVSGESGRESPEPIRAVSLMRVSEKVRSSDWARFCNERGLANWSFSLDSSSESDPRLSASSPCRALWGTP